MHMRLLSSYLITIPVNIMKILPDPCNLRPVRQARLLQVAADVPVHLSIPTAIHNDH